MKNLPGAQVKFQRGPDRERRCSRTTQRSGGTTRGGRPCAQTSGRWPSRGSDLSSSSRSSMGFRDPSDPYKTKLVVRNGAPQAGGSRGFLTPLAASPEPPSGTAIQTFLRELLSKLCVDPPHTGPLRSPGPDRTRRGSINDALLPPVGAPSGRRASSTPDAADSAANCGKTDASCVALTLALMVVSTVFVVTIVVVTLR